jgi:hypothetical protein
MVDAVLVYLMMEWVGPALVSGVPALGSTPVGLIMWFCIVWPPFVLGSIYLLGRLGVKMPPPSPGYRPGMYAAGYRRW